MLTNEKGFTLIEFICVLIIFGILAAMALPRFFSVVDEARNNDAQLAIAEVKARANQYYALRVLETGARPLAADILGSVTAAPNVGNDFTVAAAAAGSDIKISVTAVKGVTITSVVGTWIFPNQ